ncbi:hypothetical protein BD626DRAFT_579568 [Schizophyllum amplum]|uniref:Uncharacterized protein n=1 Tax=Schizophyllum amplum TaxID=97359 RepID=A0A550BRE4_9AGAR|nr:hypothetical protein BD626DRAFT_579568 [Auriculariopsis ampla]
MCDLCYKDGCTLWAFIGVEVPFDEYMKMELRWRTLRESTKRREEEAKDMKVDIDEYKRMISAWLDQHRQQS